MREAFMQVHRFCRIALCAAVCLAPVLLLYWAAEAGEDGVVRFRNGLYGRDQKILKAFKSHIRLRASVPAPE
jgi:murein L,D-transpeptidase YcbB/YkuD